MILSDKAQATRDRILLAAMELFYLHGYNATGLDKILKEAEVTKGNFYYHFKSKEVLALATLDLQMSLVQQEMKDAVFSKKSSPLNTLYDLLEFLASKQKKQYSGGVGHISGCYFGNFTLELSTASQPIRDKVKQIFKQYLALIESLLVMAKETGEIPSHINPVQMSSVVMGLVEGSILLDKANQEPQNFDNSIAFIKQVLSVKDLKAGR